MTKKPKIILGFNKEDAIEYGRTERTSLLATFRRVYKIPQSKTFPAIAVADVEKILDAAVRKHLGAWSVALLEHENRYAPLLLEIRKGLLGSELGIQKKDVEDGQPHEVFHSHPSKKEIESLLLGIKKKEGE